MRNRIKITTTIRTLFDHVRICTESSILSEKKFPATVPIEIFKIIERTISLREGCP
jgi:hypothetical protein